MVIIARELAVTMLRIGAGPLGRGHRRLVAGQAQDRGPDRDVLAMIAVPGQPLWLSLLIYAMVAITVISGLDYFFGLRRHMQAAREAVEQRPRRAHSRGRLRLRRRALPSV